MADEDADSPVESVSEDAHERAVEARERWLKWSALFSALFAVLAAVSSLKSSQYANEAMVEQIQASDQWGYYQAKGIKLDIATAENEILAQLGKPTKSTLDPDKYKAEQAQISAEANAKIEAAKHDLERHEIISRAVTMFQVSIAVIAISILTRRRHFLAAAIALAGIGACFFVQGLFFF